MKKEPYVTKCYQCNHDAALYRKAIPLCDDCYRAFERQERPKRTQEIIITPAPTPRWGP